MRPWRFALGIAIVLAITVWDVGLPSHHQPSTHVASGPSPSPSPSATLTSTGPAPKVPDVAGVIQPTGKPEVYATFSGTTLDSAMWDTCYPWLSQSGCTNFGNLGNSEDEWYLPSQVSVDNGLLHLVAHREPTTGLGKTGGQQLYECRSGMVTSDPGMRFKYGFIQVVADLPTGDGLWPALWLAAASFKWPPEMDLVEAWGGGSLFAASYFHFATPSGNEHDRGLITPAARAFGWHTYGLSWTSKQITWLLDGKVILTTRRHVPHQEMYLVADLAEAISKKHPDVVAGDCNGSMLIRSVQVWKA
jgi:beta-glucanase (GH16 family)